MEKQVNVLSRQLEKASISCDKELLARAFQLAQVAEEHIVEDPSYYSTATAIGIINILSRVYCDQTMVLGVLLYPFVLCEKNNLEKVGKDFGSELESFLRMLCKINKVQSISSEKNSENTRKMFIALSKDIRAMYVKIAGRIFDMKNYQKLNEEIKRAAEENLNIYCPIAARIGVFGLKYQLEEVSFPVAYPKENSHVRRLLKEYSKREEEIIQTATRRLEERLKKDGIQYNRIDYREKQRYSVFKKMQLKKVHDIENIYDIFALRVIAHSVDDCYRILGIIHKYWKPLPNRFKDYIAVPKANGYQSLHTVVFGLGKSGKAYCPVEIQIRTEEMHYEAAVGTAAHWSYKEQKELNKTDWVQSIISLADDIQESSESLADTIRSDTGNQRIFAITPQGDIKDLPEGATPIDFAYAIHTDIGNHLDLCYVNGKVVPLSAELKSGDVVEIKTKKSRVPNPTWMSMVKTSQAKAGIRQWLKGQTKENILKNGRDEINNFLKRIHKDPLDKDFSLLKNYKDKNLTIKEREALVIRVGEGTQKASDIIKNILQEERKNQRPQRPQKLSNATKTSTNENILVMGDNELKTRLSACCKPEFPEPITGFVTRGGYVSVHAQNCSFVKKHQEDRFVECHWENEERPFQVEFYFHVQNVLGIVSAITSVFAQKQCSILSMQVQTNKGNNTGRNTILVETSNIETLDSVQEALESLDGIISVSYKILD